MICVRSNNKTSGRKDNGDGTVYQVSQSQWKAAIQIGVKPDGRPLMKQFSSTTEVGVRKKLKEFKKERGKFDPKIGGHKITVKDKFDQWLRTYKFPELKPSSYDRLERTVETQIYPEIGNIQFRSLTRDDVQSLIARKVSAGMSFSSIKKIYLAINACYKHDLSLPPHERCAIYNPASGVSLPRERQLGGQSEIRVYSENEINSIKNEIYKTYKNGTRKYPYGEAYILILNTGLRMGEALALDKNDVDEINGRIHIRKNAALTKKRDARGKKIGGYNYEVQNDVKTFSGKRWVSLNKNAKDAVSFLKNSNPFSVALIATKNNERVLPTNFERTFSRILKNAGIKNGGNVHSLRHTFASVLFKNGVDIKVISKLLGHSSVKITYDIYVHVIEEQQIAAVKNIVNL